MEQHPVRKGISSKEPKSKQSDRHVTYNDGSIDCVLAERVLMITVSVQRNHQPPKHRSKKKKNRRQAARNKQKKIDHEMNISK